MKHYMYSWEKQVGDKIEEGDAVATVETDKASVSLDYQDEGNRMTAKYTHVYLYA